MAGPLGAAPGIILGTGLGAAAATAIEPVLESAKQTAWKNNQVRVLSPDRYAQLVAQGAIELSAGRAGAALEGFAPDKFDPLVYLEQRAPTHGEAQDLRRRDKISREQLLHSFAKEQIEQQYWDALADLVDDRLSPQVVALAIVRGLMDNPGILPVGPPSAVGKVQAFPVSDLDPVAESQSSGFNKERLAVLAGIMGRPMGPESAATAYFRNILELADYQRAISEGDVRNEWAEAILETARQIPSVADFVRANIKGWITDAERDAGAARHGMSAEDAQLLYLAAGRPAAPGQMATAVARGIEGPEGRPMDEAQFLKGIRESDIRPEWGPMLYGIRFKFPPLFQLNRLVAEGAVEPDTAEQWAKWELYHPDVVAALKKFWMTPTTTSTAATPASKAQNQLWTATHRSYIGAMIGATEARARLTDLGMDAAEQTKVLDFWNAERSLIRAQLTPAQIKKAVAEKVTNPATGQPWNQNDALAALVDRGYASGDALTFLAE